MGINYYSLPMNWDRSSGNAKWAQHNIECKG